MANWTMKELPILRAIVRPRLALALFCTVIFFALLTGEKTLITKLLLSWDFGTAFYIILVGTMMWNSCDSIIRQRAASQDENGFIILGFTVFGVIASLIAIFHELVVAKALSGHAEGQAVALAAGTVVLSWLFMQTMFALHYAHAFYGPDQKDTDRGLDFPGKLQTPDYWDFLYFSFIIGTSAQTADVNIISRVIRRIALLQCVIVFFFNTSILALAINVGASLI